MVMISKNQALLKEMHCTLVRIMKILIILLPKFAEIEEIEPKRTARIEGAGLVARVEGF